MRLSLIDSFLNQITMYRSVLYALIFLSSIGILFGFLQILPFSGFALIELLIILLVSIWVSHKVFARFFKATTNSESYLITALILFLTMAPIASMTDVYVSIAAGFIATISKYLFAINKKHLFNPAAVTLFLLGLFGFGNEIWWVGSAALLPFVTVAGLLIVRKIRRFHLLISFLAVAVLLITLLNVLQGMEIADAFFIVFTSWPLIFFGTIMLTEPLTTPPTKKLYMSYGAIVGFLFSIQFHFGPVFSSPELALVLGNIYAFIVSPKEKLFLSFLKLERLSPNIYEIIFKKPSSFSFRPGQYLEWTFPHLYPDSRGIRRFFTIASSPTEDILRLGIRIDPESSSTFKKKLLSITKDASIIATQLAGDFTLPDDSSKKLTFIAGGIGITPFRSIVSFLLDKKEKRDIKLFYLSTSAEDFVYKEIFAKAQKIFGLQTIYIATNDQGFKGEKGRLTQDLLQKYTPDYLSRIYYLSGPNVMVEGYKSLLVKMGVERGNIITDYFPGF